MDRTGVEKRSVERPTTTKERATARVSAGIRTGIKLGRFVPGQRLVETDLMREFGVSRGPLREALASLAAEGLVDIEPFRGVRVRPLTQADVVELYQIREALEGLAARLAALNIERESHRGRLETAIADIESYRGRNDVSSYMTANARFHDLIVELSGNGRLAKLLSQLRISTFRLQVHSLIDQGFEEQSIDEHRAVADAVLAGAPDRAEKAMRAHARGTCVTLLRAGEEFWGDQER